MMELKPIKVIFLLGFHKSIGLHKLITILLLEGCNLCMDQEFVNPLLASDSTTSSQAILCIHKSFGAGGLLAHFIQYLLQGLFAQTIHTSSMSVLLASTSVEVLAPILVNKSLLCIYGSTVLMACTVDCIFAILLSSHL